MSFVVYGCGHHERAARCNSCGTSYFIEGALGESCFFCEGTVWEVPCEICSLCGETPKVVRPTYAEHALALEILRNYSGPGIMTMLEAVEKAKEILAGEH